MRKKQQPPAAGELSRLERTLEQIEQRLARETSWRPVMFRAFAGGICTALGAMAAVAVIVPVMIWMLRGVHWPPIMNTFVEDLATRIEQMQERRGMTSSSPGVAPQTLSGSVR